MGALDHNRLRALIGDFSDVRLLVVGDLVLDEYVWGEVDRVSPEAPVPVVQVRDETVVLGGAANVVRNLVALGATAALVSIVGDDEAGDSARKLMAELGLGSDGLVVARGRATTRKTRVIARTQQVVRFDRESVGAPDESVGQRVVEAVERALTSGTHQGAVIEDYGKGVLAGSVAEAVMRRLADARIPTVVDPKVSLNAYRGAALFKPNLREAEALSGIPIRNENDLNRAGQQLRERIGGGAVVITRGAAGMTLFEGEGHGVSVPTVARAVYDVQGAGDTAIAALTLALRVGASLFEAAVIANAAAGVVVGKVGTATANATETGALLAAAIEVAEGVDDPTPAGGGTT
jgi:rfaE bifunctional protein kinase chain/domain